jgi:foldase protein PrsA
LLRVISAFAAVLVAVFVLGSCRGGARESVIVRTDARAITEETLVHWMSVLAPEHIVPDPPRYTACVAHQEAFAPQSTGVGLKRECQEQYRALKQQALDLLISSQWLIDEAADQGLRASDQEIQRRLVERPHTSFRGAKRLADVRFMIKAELASASIRQVLMEHEPTITHAQIATYYKKNIQRFERPERRYVDIDERLNSEAAARRVIREAAQGKSLSDLEPSLPGAIFHESLDRTSLADVVPKKKSIVRAIFAAKLHVLVGPTPLNHRYSVFEVTRITSATRQPLNQVQSWIEKHLAGEQQRRTLARFIKAWRSKWIARTNCAPGHVVQKCRQYNGSRTPEDPFTLT